MSSRCTTTCDGRARPPGAPRASTIAAEDGKPLVGAGECITRSIAAKEQRELHAENGKVSYSYSQPASEGSPRSTITFWHVGVGAHTAVVSCFIDSKEGDSATKERVMPRLFRSFNLSVLITQASNQPLAGVLKGRRMK